MWLKCLSTQLYSLSEKWRTQVICLSPPRTEWILWSNLAWRVLARPQTPLPHLLQIYKVPSPSYIEAQEYRNLMPKIARHCGLKLSHEHQYLLDIANMPVLCHFWLNVEGEGKKDGEDHFLLQTDPSPFTLRKQARASRAFASSTKRLDIRENRLSSHIH